MEFSDVQPISPPNRTELLAAKLQEMAAKLGPRSKLPTFRELCRLYRVSKATLDHALRGLEERGLVERRQGSGIYVSSTFGRKTVGVVLGTNIMTGGFSPFWGLLLQAARAQLLARSYRFHSYLNFPQGEELFAAHAQLECDLKAKRLDGLLAIAEANPEHINWLQGWNVPLVSIPGGKVNAKWHVGLESMIPAAAAKLAKEGCRRIALLSISQDGRFRATLEHAGLPFSPELVWTPDGNGFKGDWGDFEEYGFLSVSECWSRTTPRVDGLVITDDTMARGALMALYKAGIDVGRDVKVAVATNRGSPLLRPYQADLIVLEHVPEELLDVAVNMLETLMNGGTPPVNQVLIPPHLLSTRSIPPMPIGAIQNNRQPQKKGSHASAS